MNEKKQKHWRDHLEGEATVSKDQVAAKLLFIAYFLLFLRFTAAAISWKYGERNKRDDIQQKILLAHEYLPKNIDDYGNMSRKKQV